MQSLYRSVYDEDDLLNHLPSRLKYAIYVASHGYLVKHIPIFDYISNVSYRYYLLRKLEPLFYTETELVCSEAQPLDGIIFLVNGSAAIVQIESGCKSEQVLDYLLPRNFIGHETPLTVLMAPLTVRAEEDCCFFMLKFSTIDYMLQTRPELCSLLQKSLTLATEAQQSIMQRRRFRQQRFEFLKEINRAYKKIRCGQSDSSFKAVCSWRHSTHAQHATDNDDSHRELNDKATFTILDNDDNCDFVSLMDNNKLSSRSRSSSIEISGLGFERKYVHSRSRSF